jgi:hypothetical protein
MHLHTVTVKANTLPELKSKVFDLYKEMETYGNNGVAETLEAPQKENVFDTAPTATVAAPNAPVEDTPVHDTATVSSAPVTGDVDAEGIPWDKRIHASSKTKKADGTWKLRRGVDKDLVGKVKIELAGGTTTEAPVVEAAAPVTAPPLPAMNVGNAHTLESFTKQFPLIVANLISEGKLTQQYLNELKLFYKVDEIWDVNEECKAQIFNQWVEFNLINAVSIN